MPAIEFLEALNLSGNKVVGLAPGAAPTDAVNMAQLNAAFYSLDQKPSARVTAPTNITLSGLQTIDGIALNTGDRVFAGFQTNQANRNVWVASAGDWTLAPEFTQGNLTPGAIFEVEEGTTYKDALFYLITPNPITVGTTALTWSQQNKPYTPVAGNGILISGTQISIDPAVVTRKFAATIGNGTANAFAINHNLNTFDVNVTVYRTASPRSDVRPYIDRTSVNQISVQFAGTPPAANEFRVVVIA